MQVSALTARGVPQYAVEQLQENGITELTPPQEQAVEKQVLDGDSVLVSSPTASGKTLIATLRIAQLLEESERKKAVYLVPLKALGSEKYQDYSDFFGDHADVALSIGDKDSSDRWIESKDVIVMTVEKLDAVLRHNPSWITDVETVVVDEIHLLNDEGRGPTLEVTLTRLRELMDFQLIGLSATVNNAAALAEWLDCTLVESDYRPVELLEGVHHDNEITFYDTDNTPVTGTRQDDEPAFVTGTEKLAEEQGIDSVEDSAETMPVHDRYGRPVQNLLHDALTDGNQQITFVRSRKSAESAAERCGTAANDHLSREEEKALEELADDVRTVLGSPTKQCRRLADCIADGAAFHHAGLLARQRSLIEDAFRDGLIKGICATPTLAAGVSLPAYRIVIRDVKRYTDSGLNFIPTMEYKQMAGRAGRPEHHDEGQAVAVAKNSGDKDEIRDRYVLGEPEKIYSKLAVEPVLRMHALGLIATRFATDFDDLSSFFGSTFYAHQYGDDEEIVEKLRSVVETLDKYGFVDAADDGGLRATKIGKRVAELYIDPYTAHTMLSAYEQARNKQVPAIAYLQVLSSTVEMKPRLRIRKNEQGDIEEMLAEVEDELLVDVPKPWDDLQYDQFLKSLKTAMMLQAWINEQDEDRIIDKFSVTPGGIRAKVEQADWLLYAAEELCTLKEWDDVREDVSKLRTRIKHGIKAELLSLVRFDNVGRVRARALFKRDITSASDIRETDFNQLKNAVGKKTAESLKEQVGQEDVFDKENILDYFED